MTPPKLNILSIKHFCKQLCLFFTLNMLFEDNIKPHLHVKMKVLILKTNTHKMFKLAVIETLISREKRVHHKI